MIVIEYKKGASYYALVTLNLAALIIFGLCILGSILQGAILSALLFLLITSAQFYLVEKIISFQRIVIESDCLRLNNKKYEINDIKFDFAYTRYYRTLRIFYKDKIIHNAHYDLGWGNMMTFNPDKILIQLLDIKVKNKRKRLNHPATIASANKNHSAMQLNKIDKIHNSMSNSRKLDEINDNKKKTDDKDKLSPFVIIPFAALGFIVFLFIISFR